MRRHARSSPRLLESEAVPGSTAPHDGNSTVFGAGGVDVTMDAWDTFHAGRVKTTIARARGLNVVCVALMMINAALHVYKNGFDIGFVVHLAVAAAFVTLFIDVTYRVTHEWDTSWSYWVGCIKQLLFFLVVNYVVLSASLLAPNELMQHRLFLTMSTPVLVSAPFTLAIPPYVFALVYCPIWMLAWLHFHHLVGFLNVTCVFFAIAYCVAITYLEHLTNKDRWDYFQTVRALEEERKLLVATQQTLHGMLSVLWDASCTCNTHGVISSSTRHLEQLLGAAEDLVGSSLCAFAANSADEDRLQEFLKKIASAADHQALSLQCALRPEGQCTSAYDVALYGIKLPPNTIVHTLENRDRLFVGIKASAPEAIVGESSCSTFTDNFITGDGPEHSTHQHSSLGSLSWSDTLSSSSHVGPRQTTVSEQADTPSVSSLPSNAVAQSFESNHQNEKVQFEPVLSSIASGSDGEQNVVPRSLECVRYPATCPSILTSITGKAVGKLSDIGVQSDLMLFAEVAVQAGAALPPRMPSPVAPQRRQARVNLRTRQLAVTQFKETPHQTLEGLLWEVLRQINPRGRGCCYMHVGLLVLQQCISIMTVRQCRQNLRPRTGWQCMQCFVCNEDDPELEERVCCVCLSEPPGTEHDVEEAEEAPSYEADVESSSQSTDAVSQVAAL